MSDFTTIAWTDLETTGLSPSTDSLLEVGIVLTDRDLNWIDECSWVVLAPRLDLMRMHPVVRAMHATNGLFDDVLALADQSGPYPDASRVDDSIVDWLNSHEAVERGKIALGGSGVSHFDVRWIGQHLPVFGRMLYRSTVDVGVLRRFIENVADRGELVPQQHRDLSHRALDDARDHLAEARVYQAFFRAHA